MNTRMLSLIGFTLFIFAINISAQEMKTEKFKVSGNCELCKARIEKAAKSVEGVTSASWNKDAKMAEATFNPSKTNLDKIELAIAGTGHDTELHKATDEAYNKLPGCCKYPRKSDG